MGNIGANFGTGLKLVAKDKKNKKEETRNPTTPSLRSGYVATGPPSPDKSGFGATSWINSILNQIFFFLSKYFKLFVIIEIGELVAGFA